ncbi:MAG: hypothetical protein NTU57_05665 [Candidatus Aenigmarchaeota archaeon]|nr:hypothetical protein [Candidatus Aenigmarchaeota archaeon]
MESYGQILSHIMDVQHENIEKFTEIYRNNREGLLNICERIDVGMETVAQGILLKDMGDRPHIKSYLNQLLWGEVEPAIRVSRHILKSEEPVPTDASYIPIQMAKAYGAVVGMAEKLGIDIEPISLDK